MGPIQAALNQLTGSILGGVRNVAVMGKAVSKLKKEEADVSKEVKKVQGVAPTSETAEFQKQLQMASPRIKGVSPKGSRKYVAPADLAAVSGNMAIQEKARSSSFDIATRLSMLKKDEGGAE